jgi:hypothetical protein
MSIQSTFLLGTPLKTSSLQPAYTTAELKSRYEQVDRECRHCLLCGMPASGSLVLSFSSRNTPLEEQGWWGTGLCKVCYNDPDSAGKVHRIAGADIRRRMAAACWKKEQWRFGILYDQPAEIVDA